MIDAITLEVIRNRLDVIANEMEETLLRSSFSPVIKEALDASAALFDRAGRTLTQAAALPAQLGMIVTAVGRLVEVFPADTMQPGDVYLLNDPYDGGTHLPDITILEPIWFAGEVVALAASLAHHQDVGGKTPGSTPPDATEIYAEGLRIPPIKLFDQGVRNDTLVALMCRNSRTPEALMGDIGAQIACGRVGARGVASLCAEYGPATLIAAIDQLMVYAERLTRAEIERFPDGVYSFEDYVDHDGIELGLPLRIKATVTIAGSDLTIDFTGTSPQARGSINSVPSSTRAAVYYVVRSITSPDIPNNDGCFRPVKIIYPPGSLVNPNPPAAVSVRTVTIKRVVDTLFGAFAQAIPERIHAASCGQLAVVMLGGIDPGVDSGDRDARSMAPRSYVTWLGVPTAGGMGARPDRDGIDIIDTDVTNLMNEPIEATEMNCPVRVHFCRVWPDSGGAGRFRGGLGYQALAELLRGDATLSHRRDRHDFAPWGLHGGHAAPTSRTRLVNPDGSEEWLPSKTVRRVTAGAQFEIFTTGGAGYGDPLTRPPELVQADVMDGRVSRAVALDLYGVALADSFAIDAPATATRRAELRAARGPIAWVFDRGPDYAARLGRSQYE